MTVNKLPREEFESIYTRVPRLCVDLIIKTQNGIVLTLRSIEPYKGFWHFPGGTVLMNEKIEDAAYRIAKEEVGVDIKIEQLLGYMEFHKENGNRYAVSLGFLVSITSGTLRGSEQGEEIQEAIVIPSNIVPQHGDFLKKYLKMSFE